MRKCFLFVLMTLVGCAHPQPKSDVTQASLPPLPQTIAEAVHGGRRVFADRVRDKYRHPRRTLEFFGLKPDMTVVEIWPASGWYAQIIAPLLTEHGKYYAAVRPVHNPQGEASLRLDQFLSWQRANPDVKVTITNFDPPDQVDIAPAGSADMVLTFRNIHNWMRKGAEQSAFNAFYKALKPGGILGVTEHREFSNRVQDPEGKRGYVHEKYVIELAKRAGFKLIAKSEINSNPKDKKNYPAGVWTLPPTYRLGDKDRAKYAAIGESDRMTLKFMKPLKKYKKRY